jgi:hypothetical protein
MTTITRLHGDHQLDQLAAQFEHWRQHRTHPRERIPKSLGPNLEAPPSGRGGKVWPAAGRRILC